MAISIYSNNGKEHYGIKHYTVDTESEVNKLPTMCHPGSTAFVIETSATYMLDNSKKWKKVNLGGGSGSSIGTVDDDDTLIYDGGTPI